MKMSFLFGHIFWGILLLLWGISLILKGFNIVDLPLVKIFIAVIIILFGLRLLFGDWSSHHKDGSRVSFVTAGSDEYTSVFGSQTVDLTGLDPDSPPLEITAVFGSSYVKLPNDIDFKIHPTAVFGSAIVPTLASPAQPPLGTVKIEANAVFGKIEFVYKEPKRDHLRAKASADSTQGAPTDSL
ncbi:MAG: cell wall-active antibiotics response protein [Candidatus Cloacimonetes bacterium]|jgi:hypothetical protein|nr:cell wall-active antibiotics response protein [Candidatus Cloacimonadota bacterium]MDY0366470.1 hypothetical protein [Candidatus Syntrophosphaera sp.]HPH61178.1 hypothetical protein [Candidatus Syntrophosphaera sp.]